MPTPTIMSPSPLIYTLWCERGVFFGPRPFSGAQLGYHHRLVAEPFSSFLALLSENIDDARKEPEPLDESSVEEDALFAQLPEQLLNVIDNYLTECPDLNSELEDRPTRHHQPGSTDRTCGH